MIRDAADWMLTTIAAIGAVAVICGAVVIAVLTRKPVKLPQPQRRSREQEESREAADVDRIQAEAAKALADAEAVKAARDALERARAASKLRG